MQLACFGSFGHDLVGGMLSSLLDPVGEAGERATQATLGREKLSLMAHTCELLLVKCHLKYLQSRLSAFDADFVGCYYRSESEAALKIMPAMFWHDYYA